MNVAVAPSELAIEPVTSSFAAGTKPLPSPLSSRTVTVNVCAVPTRFTAFCAIVINALTHRLVAGPELRPVPSVATLIDPLHGDRRRGRDGGHTRHRGGDRQGALAGRVRRARVAADEAARPTR